MAQLQNIVPGVAQKAKRDTPRKPLLTEPQITALLCILPALLLFLLFVIYPIYQSARYSLFEWNGLGPLTNYIELKNYDRLLHDPVFWGALGNNLFIVVWSLLTQIPVAVFLAILLTRPLKGTVIFRTLFFVPFVLSDVIIASLWQWIYNPTIGLGNALLKAMHLPTQGFLGDTNMALLWMCLILTWKFLGFHIVLYIAAIQGISEELYEAARIDGASGWDLHRHITVPLMIPTIRTDAVLIIIGSIKTFDLFWVMTQGGPSNRTQLIATFMYQQAFRGTDWGYGAALAFAMFLIAFVFALVFLYITRQQMQNERA
jgi:raffinose/stachyose/melibiose transport system permease protein